MPQSYLFYFIFFSSNLQYWKAPKARSNIARKCFEYEIVQFKTNYSAFGQNIRENYKLKFNRLNGASSKHSKVTISVFLNLFSLIDFPTALVGDLYAIQGLATWTMDFLTCRHQI